MSRKTGKKKHTLFIVMAIMLIVLTAAALILMTHNQLIVGTIQSLAAGTVNTKNLDEPLGVPMEGMKENGQYIMTEILYSDHFPMHMPGCFPSACGKRRIPRCAGGFRNQERRISIPS